MDIETNFENFKYSKPIAQQAAGSVVMGVGAGVMAFGEPNTNKTVAGALFLGSALFGVAKSLVYTLALPFTFILDTGRNAHYIYNVLNNQNSSDLYQQSDDSASSTSEEESSSVVSHTSAADLTALLTKSSVSNSDNNSDDKSFSSTKANGGSISPWDYLSSLTTSEESSDSKLGNQSIVSEPKSAKPW